MLLTASYGKCSIYSSFSKEAAAVLAPASAGHQGAVVACVLRGAWWLTISGVKAPGPFRREEPGLGGGSVIP